MRRSRRLFAREPTDVDVTHTPPAIKELELWICHRVCVAFLMGFREAARGRDRLVFPHLNVTVYAFYVAEIKTS